MTKYAQNYLNTLINSGLNMDHSGSLRSSGNIANTGFISPIQAKLYELGIINGPNVSDYAYEQMKRRGNEIYKKLPSVLASNPDLKHFGEIGKNTIFQKLYDKIAPGGSREDAYKSIMSNFGTPGLSHQVENAINAKNMLSNLDTGMSDADGNWDYAKSRGFNRAETIKNLGAFKRRFG